MDDHDRIIELLKEARDSLAEGQKKIDMAMNFALYQKAREIQGVGEVLERIKEVEDAG